MSTDASPTPPESTEPSHRQQPFQKSFSCVLCAQRKVRCDRTAGGCSNCIRSRVNCVYKTPPPPRRQKRGLREVDSRARLRIYEEVLRKLGVDPEALVAQELNRAKKRASISESRAVNDFYEAVLPDEVKSGRRCDEGLLVSESGKSRYLENTLWTSLKSEFRDSDVLEDSSSDEDGGSASLSSFSPTNGGSLLLSSSRSGIDLHYLHPHPAQVFKLWQTYLDNVNPLVKVFHTPTVQQIVSSAAGSIEDIPKNTEALLFAIYAVSVESLSEPECLSIMDESKTGVSRRFRSATQVALVNANFMKSSDPMVLQALTLFIASLYNDDPRVIWVLTGVASRIAQRLGLHRDPDTLNLPPFESEMRRRLWWQIVMQDGFAEKLAGTGRTSIGSAVKPPLNLNDSDLFPGMKEPPKEHDGATEMMFFLIRVHLGEFLSKSTINAPSNFDGVWNKLTTSTASLDVKLQAITELETMYTRKFLRYCDESVTWHGICALLIKSIIAMLRFMAHTPDHSSRNRSKETPTASSSSDHDTLFLNTISILENQTIAYINPSLHGYLWHINAHFQWKALIHVLSELCHRTTGPEVQHAWDQVQILFNSHPQLSAETSKTAFLLAVGNLTLRAWEKRVAARVVPLEREPAFVGRLRGWVNKRMRAISKGKGMPMANSAQFHTSQGLRDHTVPAATSAMPTEETSTSNVYHQNALDSSGSTSQYSYLPQQLQQHGDQQFVQPLPLSSSLGPSFLFQSPADDTNVFNNEDPSQMDWATWNSLLADLDGDNEYMRNDGIDPATLDIGLDLNLGLR
ncbi:unnamed protein product [Periconia digitata]|uniref:Zn(2)-C6 fungal-type domain-containing protein n=1 Tax=Periconia digitata TaxID=1303443 RepID=A0A9W4XRI7_9PLEO|nr:unnamed protein product [Periconia digitata]